MRHVHFSDLAFTLSRIFTFTLSFRRADDHRVTSLLYDLLICASDGPAFGISLVVPKPPSELDSALLALAGVTRCGHTSHCHLYLEHQEGAVNIDHTDKFGAFREGPEQDAERLQEQGDRLAVKNFCGTGVPSM